MKKVVFIHSGDSENDPWRCEIDGVVLWPLDELYEEDLGLGSPALNPLWDYLSISVEFIEP